ncbi:hypothetical protein ACFVUS_12400 [Nocardia sp. NPDC058058]|uniref:hypothetical protein n=1 Tax=Nocardia sp. NPDC058058 TaxID=3346317 RepID=UPI0036DD40BE
MSAFEDALNQNRAAWQRGEQRDRETEQAAREFAETMRKHQIPTNFRFTHNGRADEGWYLSNAFSAYDHVISWSGEIFTAYCSDGRPDDWGDPSPSGANTEYLAQRAAFILQTGRF